MQKLLKNSAEVLFFKIYNSNKENIYPILQKHLLVLWDLYRMFGVVVITTNLPHIDVLQNSETKTFILDISYSKYHKTPVTLEEIYKQIIWTRGWTEKIKSDMWLQLRPVHSEEEEYRRLYIFHWGLCHIFRTFVFENSNYTTSSLL